MLLGFVNRAAPSRVKSADEMAAVERIGGSIRLECRLLTVELVADLEAVDTGVAFQECPRACRRPLLAAVNVDTAEEGELALRS